MARPFGERDLRPRVRSLDVRSYRDARDLFAAVYDAAAERQGILRELEQMESKEGVRAQSYEPMPRAGSVSDKMAATDARIDYEGEKDPLLAEDDALIALAESLIWGPRGGDMTGGVLHVMGYRTAKAVGHEREPVQKGGRQGPRRDGLPRHGRRRARRRAGRGVTYGAAPGGAIRPGPFPCRSSVHMDFVHTL